MCDNEECEPINPGTIKPAPLPEQMAGGVEVVSTLPNVDDAKEGILYIYFTDPTDASTFSGAFVLNTDANQLVNVSGSGGEGHIYTFEDTTNGFKVFQDGAEIYEYAVNTDVMATKAYVDGVVGDIEAALRVINNGGGA